MFVGFTVSFFVCLISFTVNLTLIKLYVSPVPPSVASMTWSQQPVLHPRALSVASPSLCECFQWMQLSQVSPGHPTVFPVSPSVSIVVVVVLTVFHYHQHRPVFPVCPFFPVYSSVSRASQRRVSSSSRLLNKGLAIHGSQLAGTPHAVPSLCHWAFGQVTLITLPHVNVSECSVVVGGGPLVQM